MEALLEIGVFAAKALIVIAALGAAVAVIAGSVGDPTRSGDRLRVRPLNKRIRGLRDTVRAAIVGQKTVKREAKKRDKKKDDDDVPTTFVLDFEGDVTASAVDGLREEITGIVGVASENDEVILRLESPGGTVTGYGLAAAQLERLKEANLKLTVAVDKVAASGGYMMACVADSIVAAPFAVVGSIGVLAIVPNASEALEKLGIGVHEFTAGRYKRTVSTFSQITPDGREKFVEELEVTHRLFKDFINTNRPALNIEEVATGEHWHARTAIELGLVDRIATSDELLLENVDNRRLLNVSFEAAQSFSDRLPIAVSAAGENIFRRLWTSILNARHGL